MIRVAIWASTPTLARGLAEVISGDERIQVVEARAVPSQVQPSSTPPVDVVLAAHVGVRQLARASVPVVLVDSAGTDAAFFSRNIHAALASDASAEEISAAIIAAAAGLSVLTSSQVRRWLRQPPATQDSPTAAEPLTAREFQVLRMLADGLGNKEIAARLDISTHTAKFHVAQILAKLGAGSRAKAVSIGIRRGIVPI